MKTPFLVALALVSQFVHAADSPVTFAAPLTVYESLPAIEEAAISPLGDKLATVRVKNDARTIVISELPSGKVIKRLAMGELRLGGLRWPDERYLLILTRSSGLPWSMRSKHEDEMFWLQGRIYDTVSGTARQFPFQTDHRSVAATSR
jgi:hypothetical protein